MVTTASGRRTTSKRGMNTSDREVTVMTIYILAVMVAGFLLTGLIKEAGKMFKEIIDTETNSPYDPKTQYYFEVCRNDKGTVFETHIYNDDGELLGTSYGLFRDDRKAVYICAKKYYRKLEYEFIQREKRVNYALGETKTIEDIKVQFKYTQEAITLQKIMEDLENVNSANGS